MPPSGKNTILSIHKYDTRPTVLNANQLTMQVSPRLKANPIREPKVQCRKVHFRMKSNKGSPVYGNQSVGNSDYTNDSQFGQTKLHSFHNPFTGHKFLEIAFKAIPYAPALYRPQLVWHHYTPMPYPSIQPTKRGSVGFARHYRRGCRPAIAQYIALG